MVGHCERQETGLDGPLSLSSGALLMLLFASFIIFYLTLINALIKYYMNEL